MTGYRAVSALLLVVLVAAATTASAQQWTRFRGPNGTGIVEECKTIPTQWTADDFNWRVSVPGIGHSHPVIWKERLFLTTATDDGALRSVLCYRTTDGKELWRKTYRMEAHDKHNLNSYASATPAVDAERVYVTFADPSHYLLVALDHNGSDLWSFDLGPFKSRHGQGTSPILYQDKVILGNEQGGADEGGVSFLIALDKKTGKQIWRSPRTTARVSYSTPMVFDPSQAGLKGPMQLIFNSQAHGITSVEAETGKLLWQAPVFDKRTCSSPVWAGGLLVGTCGSGGGGNYLVAMRPGGSGDVSDTHVAWREMRSSRVPYVPTPITNGDVLFLWTTKGVVTSLDAKTGKIHKSSRVPGRYWTAPVRIGNRLYMLTDDGECVVLKASKDWEVLARNPILQGSHASVAVADGTMYIRTFGHLISLGGVK